MKVEYRLCIATLIVFCTVVLSAQNTQPATTTTAVPRLIRVNSTFHPANGAAGAAVESASLSIYAEETGGSPLWQETQNVAVDNDGHYSILLGSTRNDGIPLELFASGEPRWLGVQFQRAGEVEQRRLLLASVPYALKAADAETLGGQPLSAFVLANPAVGSSAATPSSTIVSTAVKAPLPRISSGTPGYIGEFVNATDLGNSVMFQNTGKVGLGTTSPLDYFHVAFTDTTGSVTGYAVQNLGSGAASYSGMLFYDQNGALGQFQGFNNSTHEYRINNIAKTGAVYDGTINFMTGNTSRFKVLASGDVDMTGNVLKGGTSFMHNYGSRNTALGLAAANPPVTGSANTAVGYFAQAGVANGNNNTAVGSLALELNVSGVDNTAVGNNALWQTIASTNTGVGDGALYSDTTGGNNIAMGRLSLGSVNSGNYNIGIGDHAGTNITSTSYNIMIGHQGVAADDHIIRIGDVQTNTYIAGIAGVTVAGAGVLVDASGHLGVAMSSRRYKEDILDMGDSSSNLFRLRPVTYRYKQPYTDGSKPLDYGLVAEEVAEIYPDLVVRNQHGEIETVQYHKLAPMLLNELQKEHRQNIQQDETIHELQNTNRQQSNRIQSLENRLAALEALLSNN